MMIKNKVQTALLWMLALCVCGVLLGGSAAASLHVSEEKTHASFSQEGDTFIATLIPRAKSTSVSIYFEASGGTIDGVEAMDIKEAEDPKVDHKDFKSELFIVTIDGVGRGGEATLKIRSDFFTSSTQFWVFNPESPERWMDSGAVTKDLGNLVQEMRLTVQDGGPFDSDGRVDGRIQVIGGPKDSFWGYALGTLFIRFFGIFLVLSVLMAGMLISGKIFRKIEEKKGDGSIPDEKVPETADRREPAEEAVKEADDVDDARKAAAISAALHIHFCRNACDETLCLFCPETASWTQQGRERIMNVRSLVLNRVNR